MDILGCGKWKYKDEFILNEKPKNWDDFKDIADKIREITFGNQIKSIWQDAFKDCKKLRSIDAPNVTKIEKSAFEDCKELRLINAPNVTVIEDSAFEGCENLWKIDCPEVTSIEKNAFKGCKQLMKINFPKVTSIGEGAFEGCENLFEIDCPEVTSIEEGAFNWDKLYYIILPELKNLPKDFSFSGFVQKVNLSGITSLGNNKFNNRMSLTEIDISGVTSIGDSTFEKCIFLKNINLPNAKSIGEKAFSGCTNLEEITLPNVTTVGEKAFWDCTSLKKVYATKLERVAYNSFPDGLIEEIKKSNKNLRLKIDENLKKLDAKDDKFADEIKKISPDEKLYPSGEPTIKDVKQGNIGDCWLLAALSSLVSTDEGKNIIKKCLQEDENGNVYVTLYDVDIGLNSKGNKFIPYPTKRNEIKIDKSVFAKSSIKAALWVKMIEKAFAVLRIDNKHLTDQNLKKYSYQEICGGRSAVALTAITGKIYKSKKIEKENKPKKEQDAYIEKLYNQIKKRLDNGSYVSASRLNKNSGHAYSILSVYEKNGCFSKTKYIVLRNPHGKDSEYDKNIELKIKGRIIGKKVKNGEFTLKFEDFVDLFESIDSERIKKSLLK